VFFGYSDQGAMMYQRSHSSEFVAKKIVTTNGKVQFRKVGRNDPCPCGSGKKFKKCCMQSPKQEYEE